MNTHSLNEIDYANNEHLKDITKVDIDTTLPPLERANKFIFQIKNPYHFKCRDIVVSIVFNNEENELDNLLIDYFTRENKNL